ncbi:uncharacterized protein NDAI_0A04960 [Naumovozyma dairenensis CBS 421]|uniref:Dilute domain-containing protein n=1 Tax=Naumovozyma dairenensis (strain ATCC 10597 / BCRC 20456 / CBS 421 / NBRC 0211 / NRRL Y-12639) TaxID=1071378 RepID=G0W4B3_NAUDC|nr:hypothetical protein NDAI_0A04960 [Naumovozyma dairenensis CBS 421]CCD22651.1 hypothetical protein NDAI_0A04960 [Naumovozyma dairenensis CBS 421]
MDSIWNSSLGDQVLEKSKSLAPSISSIDKLSLIKSTLKKLPNVPLNDTKNEQANLIELIQLICDEDTSEEFSTFKQLVAPLYDINDKSLTGMALIHYIIAFNRPSYIELLHDFASNAKTPMDLNLKDDIMGYTPLMWAFTLQRKECCLELFNYHENINFNAVNKDGLQAWDLITPDSPIHDYLEQNNMLQYRETKKSDKAAINDNNDANNLSTFDDDPFAVDNIDLQVAGLSLASATNKNEHDLLFTSAQDSVNTIDNNNQTTSNNIDSLIESFDFTKLVQYQYLEFSDYDIPQILDLLESLPRKYPHLTTYPASLLFQCIRYADHKKKSKPLVESLIHLSLTRIISTVSKDSDTSPIAENPPANADNTTTNTNTTSIKKKSKSLENEKSITSNGDIIQQSYWFGTLSFLYYYLCRDDGFFKNHPPVLSELTGALHSLMLELTSSIHSRLNALIEPTLLSYTTIKDVKQTLYKRDWNFFKKRKQAKLHRMEEKRKQEKLEKLQHGIRKSLSNEPTELDDNTNNDNSDNNKNDQDTINDDDDSVLYYDTEILKHLYPPSLEEQMKPSPLKMVQIFGALTYVLSLHQIHPLFQQQCLSLAMSWFSTSLFNKILKDRRKKILSRAHAIQIRLNLSALEAWIKNNDSLVPKPRLIDDFMWERFPYTLIYDVGSIDLSTPPSDLNNIATYKPINDPPLKGHKEPTKSPIHDMTNSLFYYQTFHRISQIHLEPVFELLQWLQVATTIDSEESLDSTLKLLPTLSPSQLLKILEKYNYEINEHKFSSKLKKKINAQLKLVGKQNVYLQERQIPMLALPTVPELTDLYCKSEDAYSFLPLLPVEIQDDVWEIHDENYKKRRNGHDFTEPIDQTEEQENQGENENENEKDVGEKEREGEEQTSGDMFFTEFDAPSAIVQKPIWAANDEIEENPW